MITQEQLDLYNTVLKRLLLTRKQAAAMDNLPEYVLWQVLTRYDEACGGKSAGQEWRYKIMYWMFQGKWHPSDKVSGKDLTPAEVHVMAKWSDPDRKEDFEHEIKAVMAVLGNEPESPWADYLTAPKEGAVLIDDTLSPEEQKALFREQLGVRRYKMRCGHLNNDYTSYGHPSCSICLEKSREVGDNAMFLNSLAIEIVMDF